MTPNRRLAASFCAAVALLVPGATRAASEEVPFITTPDNVTLAMLRAAGVGARDFVIDLGSGDGRIVILAAKRFGARGVGVEIVPKLVEESRANALKAGVGDKVEFLEQDLFATPLDDATVITMYLLPEVNLELRPRILALRPGTRIVSHDWDMGDWKPDRTTVVAAPDKKIGLEKKSRVHLWIVPARVEGSWCSGTKRVVITQKYQAASVDGKAARIEGAAVRVKGGRTLRLEDDRLVDAAAKDSYERCAVR